MRENVKLAFSIFEGQVKSLFFVLLLLSSVVSFYMGDTTDGAIITLIMLINTALGFFQEFKASKVSEKLMNLVKTKVYVLREGMLVQVLMEDLILGDVVHLVAGSVAPVDIEVIESDEGLIDDSIRTGETELKQVSMGEKVFAGASVAGGKVIGRVVALGRESSISEYRSKLESIKKWNDFNIFVSKITKYIFIYALSALVIAFLLFVFILGKYEFSQFFVFFIALLVGVVPEALPLIITLILTHESVVLGESKVIVKRLSSLQDLGALQFLLTDKTGTITENKLKVFAVFDGNNFKTEADGFWENSNSVSEGEYERTPMDSAYDDALNSSLGKVKTSVHKIVNFEPYRSEIGYSVFTLEGGCKIARGQIRKVLELCANKNDSILNSAIAYESKGMRVIAQASGIANQWEFSGFAVFSDPIKASSGPSLKIAHEHGVGVKILTGDSSAVAMNVAEELGLIKHPDNIISLDEISVINLSNAQLKRAVVFAKCTPENKLELIDRYLGIGPVAFLGDGINDALALKRADIGIAVDNASDIAKESADVILLEKDLSPIIKGIIMGRRAFHNVLVYIMYTLAGNAGTFFSLLMFSFFYESLPMLPIQILLNNLITDLPLMLISTDNTDAYSLKHVPHYEPKKILKRVFIFGILSSVFDFIYFYIYKSAPVPVFQTGWFVLSVLAELTLILSIRSSRPIFKSTLISLPLLLGIIASAILPFVFIYTKILSSIFKFIILSPSMLATILFILVSYVFVNEIAKYFMRRKNLYNKPIIPSHIFKS